MPSKPAHSNDHPLIVNAMHGWEVLEVSGRDAAAFLQRQTMNDVAALTAPRSWQWNGLLSSKGRLQSLFVLQQRGNETFWMVAPDTPAETLRDELTRFVFRSKLTLTCRQDLLAACRWDAEDKKSLPAPSICDESVDWMTNFQFPFTSSRRTLQILATNRAGEVLADGSAMVNADSEARWRLDDVRCGIPRLSPEQRDAWTPHMLSLDRLAAFSLKKGCYPGQEIVARTHYLGRSKRRLQRFDLAGPSCEGESVFDSNQKEQMRVFNSASWHGQYSICAIAALDSPLHDLSTAGGFKLVPTPFSGDL